jgi:hypothetical protein
MQKTKIPKRYIGIDPGAKSGAIAILDEYGTFVYTPEKMLDLDDLKSVADAAYRDGWVITIEMPEPGGAKWGAKGVYTFYKHLGHLEAIFPMATFVNPRTWQAKMWTPHIKKACDDPKQRSLAMALAKWPEYSFVPHRCKKVDYNIVDACLIALYGLVMDADNSLKDGEDLHS